MPKLVQEIFKFVKEIAAIGITVIIVEQNAVTRWPCADYAFVIQNGESVIEGRGEGSAEQRGCKAGVSGRMMLKRAVTRRAGAREADPAGYTAGGRHMERILVCGSRYRGHRNQNGSCRV